MLEEWAELAPFFVEIVVSNLSAVHGFTDFGLHVGLVVSMVRLDHREDSSLLVDVKMVLVVAVKSDEVSLLVVLVDDVTDMLDWLLKDLEVSLRWIKCSKSASTLWVLQYLVTNKGHDFAIVALFNLVSLAEDVVVAEEFN
jgi:hypothetical protein